MPAADGVVGQGQLPAVAADHAGSIGQFESPALVRALKTRRVSTRKALKSETARFEGL